MKKLLSAFLALAMTVSLLAVPGSALDPAPSVSGNVAEHWFYDQLKTDRAKTIYNALWDMFDSGAMKDGTGSYDLAELVGQDAIKDYLEGDRSLFNDFSAAKDAFDLEHPEAWYVDTSYLSFRVVQDAGGKYHAYMGPGRSNNYYVAGVQNAADVNAKDRLINAVVSSVVSGAEKITGEEKIAEQVRYVHEQVTRSLSYRYETECTSGNEGYVRTVYALVTQEGVCEAYARSMQLILNELGIPCVPVHGIQTSGEPEKHMWNAVQIGDEWYVVDATWDDPVVLDENGKIKTTGENGVDGYETVTYLLVGQDITAANWRPSGYVSTGAMEFKYPEIAMTSLNSNVIHNGGLTVTVTDGNMESVKSSVYQVSFNGDGLVAAAKKGYYFLVKMYDVNADGSVNMFRDWYYPAHMLHAMGKNGDDFDPDDDFRDNGNAYFHDTDGYLVYNVSNCEYVEFAVTTKAPPRWMSTQDLLDMGGYYSGDYSDILEETGLIFNANGGYEQTPYVKNVSPVFNTPVYVGRTYAIHMEFTDDLYHPSAESVAGIEDKTKLNDAETAMKQDVTLYYEGTTYSWGVNARQSHVFASKPAPAKVRWTCRTHPDGHGGTANSDSSVTMSGIGADCVLTALDFEFSASRMWADDSVQYEFHLTGLVGIKSNKFLKDGGWSYVFENQSAYCSYRCQGIDWNLWGQPQLLDSDIDLSKMVVEGVDGKQESLEELRRKMHLDEYDMNGRLMLVVENLDDNRSSSEELGNALEKKQGIDLSSNAVLDSSLYEIDFARICGKTIVETGDSLRMSVGFPAGIDTDKLKNVVFKVYHFLRNEKGEITGVEEIPVTVTPYGLVFLCKSFSPFAVVALDASQVKEEPSTDKTVMITSDEGGGFLFLDGTAATGAKGVVTLSKGQHVTLTVKPDDGQVVGSVTFDGHKLPVSSNGKVIIAYEDIQSSSCLLSASFISGAVQQADEKAGMTLVTPDSGNDNSSDLSDRLKRDPGTAPDSSTEVGDREDPGDPKNPFTDVFAGDYYYDAVLWAFEHEVTTGTGDGTTFSPLTGCTRAQFVTFLYRAANKPDVTGAKNSFSDVSATVHKSYYDAILWAYELGITTGTGDGTTFSPDKVVTRAQAVTFMHRYAKLANIATKTGTESFDDVENTGAMVPYYEAIGWAVANGITNGNSSTANTFGPMSPCNRAMMVTFLHRLFTESAQ